MKKQRHKRKESYSILIISNIDRESRQLHIARPVLHFLFVLMLIIFAAAGGAIYQSVNSGRQLISLREQLRTQEQVTEQYVTDKNKVDIENQELETEVAKLREELALEQQKQAEAAAEEAAETEPEPDPTFPKLYPCSEAGMMTASFSDEHPYISISTERNSNIIATADGTITSIGSDETYSYIIEIEYESGYISRYLYQQEAQLKVMEGMEVQGGDTLLTVVEEDTVLDYQILHEGEPVNPILIIEAKG